jgi:hypothetical protein
MAYDSTTYGRVPSATLANNVQTQIRTMLANAVPGYLDLIGQSSANVLSGLRGELSEDVQDEVQNAAAARAVGGGYGGSGLHGKLVARDLGRTSKQIQDDALKQQLALIDSASRTATISPSEVLALDSYNAKLRAAPNPAARARHDASLAWEASRAGSQVPAVRSVAGYGERAGFEPGGIFGSTWASGTNRNVAGPQYNTDWFTGSTSTGGGGRRSAGPTFIPFNAPAPASASSNLGPVYGTGSTGGTSFLDHDFSQGPYDWLGGGDYNFLAEGADRPAYNGPLAPDYSSGGGYDEFGAQYASFDDFFNDQ